MICMEKIKARRNAINYGLGGNKMQEKTRKYIYYGSAILFFILMLIVMHPTWFKVN